VRAAIWLAPDVAMVAACVTAFYCLFLFQGYQKLFRDSDAGWHIRTGERILATHELPRTDPYSFTRAGQPWFAWEWLSDVTVGAVHHVAGLRGVAVFYSAVIAAGVWLWFRLHWELAGDFLIACAMAPLLLTTSSIHWLARPHVLGWLFLIAAVMYAERTRWSLPLVFVFTAVWANIHPSFVLACAISFLVCIRERSARAFAAVAVTAIAPLVNPYGWRLYQHLWNYLTDSALLSRIGEFQSFDFHAPGSGQITATVILGMIGGTLALTQGRLYHFALAVAITAMALRSARALPLCALVLLPIANGAIARQFPIAYSKRLRAIDARFRGYALAPAAVLALALLVRAVPAGFAPSDFPVAAYDHIPAGARLFAPDKFGGYLIYRSNGALKVFFDGRSDLYGADFLQQYGRLVQVRPGWRNYWDTFHFTHALLPNDAPLLAALEQAGWTPVYRDSTATLLAGGRT
jgi:hypothetical protein